MFKDIIPLRALNSKACGSTFLALDKYQNKKIILKDAKPGFSEDGTSTITSLKNEEHNLKQLSKFSFIPNYLRSFMEDKDYFVCEQQMPGVDIDTFRADGNKSFLDLNQRENTILLYKNIITDIISNLNELHKNNIFLGDLSSTNILIDEKKQISSFIDISQSFNVIKNKGKISTFRTMGFCDNNIDTLLPLEQDNQQLGYVIISMFCRANMFLLIDKTGKMTINFFKKYATLNRIPKIFIEVVTRLINNPNEKLDKLINLLNNGSSSSYAIDKELCANIDSFKLSLQKAIYLSEINKIPFKKSTSVKLNLTDNFIFDNKLSFTLINIIQNKEIKFDNAIQRKLFQSVKQLNNLLLNNQKDPKIKKISIRNIFSLILCAITQANMSNKIDISKLIHTINMIYQYNSPTEGIFYKTNLLSNHLSPYLADGTTGMLMILLKFKTKFQDNTYDDEIHQIVSTLIRNPMPQNASLMHGLSGILLGLMNYMNIFHDNSCISFINENLFALPYYAYKWNHQNIIVNPSFENLDINFENGNSGIVYTIDLAKKLNILS